MELHLSVGLVLCVSNENKCAHGTCQGAALVRLAPIKAAHQSIAFPISPFSVNSIVHESS